MRFIRILLIFINFYISYCYGSIERLIDTPTSIPLKRGYFSAHFNFYHQGILTSLSLGLTNNLTLGIPIDIENAIGTGSIKCNFPPSLSAKLRILSNPNFGNLALGYFDPYGYKKKEEEIKQTFWVPGLYLTYSKSFLFLALENFINIGIALDLKGGYSMFLATQLSLNPEFRIILEGVYKEKKYSLERLVNIGIKYYIVPQLSIKIAFRGIQEKVPERIVGICYHDIFF
jgi:hypothetical protein